MTENTGVSRGDIPHPDLIKIKVLEDVSVEFLDTESFEDLDRELSQCLADDDFDDLAARVKQLEGDMGEAVRKLEDDFLKGNKLSEAEKKNELTTVITRGVLLVQTKFAQFQLGLSKRDLYFARAFKAVDRMLEADAFVHDIIESDAPKRYQ